MILLATKAQRHQDCNELGDTKIWVRIFSQLYLLCDFVTKLSVKFITICKIMSYIIIFLAISSILVIM